MQGDDEFVGRIEGDIGDLDCKIKDGEKTANMAWEIIEIKDNLAMIKRADRVAFRLKMVQKYPRAMGKIQAFREAK